LIITRVVDNHALARKDALDQFRSCKPKNNQTCQVNDLQVVNNRIRHFDIGCSVNSEINPRSRMLSSGRW